MQLPEEFNTVESFFETKYKEKGSVFIGLCYPISKEGDAISILEQVRKKYYDATHHCFAYLAIDSALKYSDDGEPSGTAGLRILNAIQHFSLNNILLIVVRYFGGTKLGVGPLGKAYYHSAYITLDDIKKVKKTAYKKLLVEFDFSSTSQIHHILSKLNAKILDTRYENKVVLEFLLKPSETARLYNFLSETLNSKANLSDTGETHFI